jgi:glutaredoxin
VPVPNLHQPEVTNFILYSRPGCHLCEMAKAALERANLNITEVSVESDPTLEAEYGIEIPVLTQNGKTLLKGVFNEARIAAMLLKL